MKEDKGEKGREEIIEDKIEQLEEQLKEEKQKRKQLEKQIQKETQENPNSEKSDKRSISRREFLKKTGLGAASLAALGLLPASALNVKTSKPFDVYTTGTEGGTLSKGLSVDTNQNVDIPSGNLDMNNNNIERIASAVASDLESTNSFTDPSGTQHTDGLVGSVNGNQPDTSGDVTVQSNDFAQETGSDRVSLEAGGSNTDSRVYHDISFSNTYEYASVSTGESHHGNTNPDVMTFSGGFHSWNRNGDGNITGFTFILRNWSDSGGWDNNNYADIFWSVMGVIA